MSDLSQIQRLIRILQILSSGRKITTKELLRRFEDDVSLRTIQRDLLTLSEAGIPVINEKTKANENAWMLISRFRSFIPMPLENNEFLAAHILKANLKIFQKTPFEDEIKSLIKKIDQIVPENIFLELDRKRKVEIYDNYTAGMYDYSPHGLTINNLIDAIYNRKCCRVKYLNPGAKEAKYFNIEPEKLVYYNGALYVIVYVRYYKSFIFLAIQRIQKLTLLDKQFPLDHVLDEKEFWKGKFGLFSGDLVSVRLQFDKSIRHHIEGRIWHSSQSFEDDKESNLILNMEVGITPELLSWILGWREYVKVLQPDDLANEIITSVDRIKKLY